MNTKTDLTTNSFVALRISPDESSFSLGSTSSSSNRSNNNSTARSNHVLMPEIEEKNKEISTRLTQLECHSAFLVKLQKNST